MLTLPADTQTGEGIGLYLLSFASSPPPRTAERPPLQFLLRYLITSWADTPQKAHDLLGQLIFAAMQNADFTVDLDPLPAETWLALKLIPRPSFILSIPIRQDRPKPKAEYVRGPLSVKSEPMAPFVGKVVGPGGIPISGARVEVPSLQLFNYTDANGQFQFAGLPAQQAKKELRILAKGRQMDVTVDQPADTNQTVVIQFDPLKAVD
jgi:hypothetical protein